MRSIVGPCPVHGGFCIGWQAHIATDRRQRVVAEAAIESSKRMGGRDFDPRLVVSGSRRSNRSRR